MSKKSLLGCLLSILAMGSAVLSGQQRVSAIHGRVVDMSNKPKAGFHLIARSAASGEERLSVTNEEGEFNFADLNAGVYFLQDQSTSPSGNPRPGVSVTAGSTDPVDLQATSSGTIQIRTESVVSGSETASIRNEFTSDPILTLPQANAIAKSGEYYGAYNLALLGEGTTPGSIAQNGVGPSLAGRPNTSNNFEVSGIDNNNPSTGGPLVTISNEAVTGLTVKQGEAASRMGHSTGGQSNAQVTQGTNLWHGGVYDYLNTRVLNAIEPGLAGGIRTQKYDQNRMGISLGGPIVPNKLFGFVNFEFIPLRANRFQLNPVFAPTAAGYDMAATGAGISATNLAVLRNTVGVAPSTSFTTTVGGVAVPVGEVNTDINTRLNQYNGVANIDWQHGSTSKLSARYVHNDAGSDVYGWSLPFFAAPAHRRAMLGQLNYTTALRSGITLNLNAGFNGLVQSAGDGNSVFPGLSAFPNINIQELGLQLGSTIPSRSLRSNTYQLGGWAEGAVHGHRLRAGGDVRYYDTQFQSLSTASGNYAYSDLNRFLLDLTPDGGGQRTFGGAGYVGNRGVWNAFVQDKMRVRNVNVELGLAYQHAQLPLSVRRQTYLAGLNVPGLIEFKQPKSDWWNIAPHVAIAFSPGSERTTIRSGFAMMYDTINGTNMLLGPEMTVNTVRDTTSTTPGFLAGGGLNSPATTAGGVGVYSYDSETPYVMQWSAGVTQALFGNMSAELAYVGNRGVHQPVQTILSDPSGVSGATRLPVFLTNPGPGFLNSLTVTQQALAAQTNAFAANGFSNPILAQRNDGTSWYNAAIFKLNDRFSSGTQISGQYTYTDARADSSGTALDLRYGRRMEPSIWARKHRATLTPVFEISSMANNWPGALRQAVNSLTVLATLTYESGALLPLSSGAGIGIQGTPQGTGVFVNPAGVSGLGTGVTPLTNSSGQTVAFLAANPNAQFVAGAPGTFSGQRPMLRLGETRNVDLAISKRFAVGHWGRIETRADAFNIFNHPQFTGLPISSLGGAGSWNAVPGYLSVANPLFDNSHAFLSGNPRTIQLALKLMF